MESRLTEWQSSRILSALRARTRVISSGSLVRSVSKCGFSTPYGYGRYYKQRALASVRFPANGENAPTLCKYSYATRVKPNCGLLRSTRAGPPLNNALKPSSRTRKNVRRSFAHRDPQGRECLYAHILTVASVKPL